MNEPRTVQYDGFALTDGVYEIPPGEKAGLTTIRVWSQSDGQWACIVNDHGPFCRRCQKLDSVNSALIANALEGVMEIRDHPDRGWEVWLNEAGRTKVETAIRRGGFDQGLDA